MKDLFIWKQRAGAGGAGEAAAPSISFRTSRERGPLPSIRCFPASPWPTTIFTWSTTTRSFTQDGTCSASTTAGEGRLEYPGQDDAYAYVEAGDLKRTAG